MTGTDLSSLLLHTPSSSLIALRLFSFSFFFPACFYFLWIDLSITTQGYLTRIKS
jgi:hypothetical protein